MPEEPIGYWVAWAMSDWGPNCVYECCRLPSPAQDPYMAVTYRCPKGHLWEYQPRPLIPGLPPKLEHRFQFVEKVTSPPSFLYRVQCSCGVPITCFFDIHDAVMAWAEHAGLKK
jgi:hypothetical protein